MIKFLRLLQSYDDSTLLLFEPLVTNGEVLARHTGFQHPPGNQYQVDVLSFHTYCDITASYAYDCNELLNGDPNYCSTLTTAYVAK